MPLFALFAQYVVSLVGHIHELALRLNHEVDRVGQRGVIGNDAPGLRLERTVVADGEGQNLARDRRRLGRSHLTS